MYGSFWPSGTHAEPFVLHFVPPVLGTAPSQADSTRCKEKRSYLQSDCTSFFSHDGAEEIGAEVVEEQTVSEVSSCLRQTHFHWRQALNVSKVRKNAVCSRVLMVQTARHYHEKDCNHVLRVKTVRIRAAQSFDV